MSLTFSLRGALSDHRNEKFLPRMDVGKTCFLITVCVGIKLLSMKSLGVGEKLRATSEINTTNMVLLNTARALHQ
jgi:hypothetical protein